MKIKSEIKSEVHVVTGIHLNPILPTEPKSEMYDPSCQALIKQEHLQDNDDVSDFKNNVFTDSLVKAENGPMPNVNDTGICWYHPNSATELTDVSLIGNKFECTAKIENVEETGCAAQSDPSLEISTTETTPIIKKEKVGKFKENVLSKNSQSGSRGLRKRKRKSKLKSTNNSGDRDAYQCERCEKTFTIKYNLHRHLAWHSNIKRAIKYECHVCKMSFICKRYLQRHVKRHIADREQNQKRFTCFECGRQLKNKNNLKDHLKQHTGDKPHKCSICNKAFVQRHHMRQHEARHAKNGVLVSLGKCTETECDECGAKFKSSKGLLAHFDGNFCGKNTFDNCKMPSDKYQCTLCPKSFVYQSKLKRHMKCHTKEREFKCDQCGKSYGYAHHLKRHTITHNQHECQKCGLKFRSQKTLGCHVEICDSVAKECEIKGDTKRKYTCKSCGEQFRNSRELCDHRRLAHAQSSPYIRLYTCQVCKKRYGARKNMRVHMKQHKSNKYQCCLCKTFFCNDKQDLKQHVLDHGRRKCKCEFCGKTFSTETNLQEHQNRTHTFKCDDEETSIAVLTLSDNDKCETSANKQRKVASNEIIKHEEQEKCIKSYKDTTCRKEYLMPTNHDETDHIHDITEQTSQAAQCKYKETYKIIIKARAEYVSDDETRADNNSETADQTCVNCGLVFSNLPNMKAHLLYTCQKM